MALALYVSLSSCSILLMLRANSKLPKWSKEVVQVELWTVVEVEVGDMLAVRRY